MIYPNSTPEFRILKHPNGEQTFQVRYVNIAVNYISKWMPIPTITEKEALAEAQPKKEPQGKTEEALNDKQA